MNSQLVTELCDKLEILLNSRSQNIVNMMSVNIQPEHEILGCHAGWLGYILGIEPGIGNFHKSKHRIANYFGFSSSYDLELWALYNPDIWGNNYGVYMFSAPRALGQDSSYFDAQVILDHWRGVAQRLRTKELETCQ